MKSQQHEDSTTPRALNTKEAGFYVGLAPITLAKMRVSGTGPVFINLTPTKVAYTRKDLDIWLESRPRRRSTSEDQALPQRDFSGAEATAA